MAGQMARAIAVEFPEFIEFKALLDLAGVAWLRFGLSAADLNRLDRWQMEMLKVYLEL